MSNVGITLAMICRDEAHTIERTLRSALPYIDSWLIADTGSNDGTQGIIKSTLAGIPGELIEFAWPDCFSTARNRVLDAVEPGSMVLWLDADDELVNGDSLAFMLSIVPGDCFSLQHEWSDGQRFTRPTVVRAGSGWRFEGRVHEVLTHSGAQSACLVGPSIMHTLNDKGVAKSRARMPWDVEVLQQAIQVDPTNARAQEYLDRTLESLRS